MKNNKTAADAFDLVSEARSRIFCGASDEFLSELKHHLNVWISQIDSEEALRVRVERNRSAWRNR